MARKLERVFRDRRLTPEEVARDEEIRRQVQQEFPPAKRALAAGLLSEILIHRVHTSGKSLAQISQQTGVSEVLLARYLAGECDIHMTTADKLAEGLGLKLKVTSAEN